MELRFKLLDDAARVPTRANPFDPGLPLSAPEAPTAEPGGGRAAVGTGLAVEIPPGHGGLVLPRSGLAARRGIALANAPGLIDPGYRGELRVLLLNTDPGEPYEVEPGDRIAQLLVVALAEPDPVTVAELSGAARGDRGFGSSGS